MGRGRIEGDPSRIASPQRVWTSYSAEETSTIGRQLAKELPEGTILLLFGDLGTGKTTLVKGLISEATATPEEEVCSPTFIYMQEYSGHPSVVHFDLYRLSSSAQFFALGLDEALGSRAICCVEWADRIEEVVPKEALKLTISHEKGGARRIVLEEAKE